MSDTTVDNSSTEKSKYTSGTVYKIIIAMTFLLAFGLIMVASTSKVQEVSANFKEHVVYILVGIFFICLAAFVPYSVYKKLAWVAYGISIILTLCLLNKSWGVEVNGATRWLKFPGVPQFQVADIVKTCMIIFIASYISSMWREMEKLKTILILWGLVGAQAILLYKISNNLSSCLVILGICFLCTFITSKNWKLHALVMGIVLIAAVVLVLYVRTHLPTPEELAENDDFRFERILGWLFTDKYELDSGYQVKQSLYAIGSGSLLGKGLGAGTQKLEKIPEAQNDMIFAIVCEELGLVGAVLLFLMYGYLIYQFYVIVKESSNVFGSVLVIGTMVHFICQIIINVCVATNMFPNTGVSLPFISSGGSALITTMMECGICIGVRRQQTRRMYQKYLAE